MAELTPEEREKIYLEEKARIEAHQVVKATHRRELADPIQSSAGTNNRAWGIFALLVCVAFVVLFGVVMKSAQNTGTESGVYNPSNSYSDPSLSSVPTALPEVSEVEVLEKEKAKIVVSKYNWTSDDFNYDYVRGSVTNKSGHNVTYWKVTAEFLDKKGTVIDSGFGNSGENLRPGASKRFEIMLSHPSGAKKARAFVDEVHFGG